MTSEKIKTNIVNVKVAYIRPKYHNLKEWIYGPNNVYIGRGRIVFIDGKRFPEYNSIWANPFKVENNREDVITQYELYIRRKINSDDNIKRLLLDLKGKTLGCWCKPNSCHGDILLKLIEEYDSV